LQWRACTLRKPVERILAGTAVSARMGWRKRAMVANALAPAVMFSAGAVVPGAFKPSAESVAAGAGAPTPHADTVEGGRHPFDRYVGYHEFYPFRALSVARARDRLILHGTGGVTGEMTALGGSEFVAPSGASVLFVSNAMGRTNELVFHWPDSRGWPAFRIDAERAQEIKSAFARQVASRLGAASART
jgi:hypothetical protein